MARNGLVELLPVSDRQTVSEEQIRVRAYLHWEAAGKPECAGTAFWLEAERELLSAMAPG